VSNFRKNKSNPFQLVVDGTHLAEPYQVAEAFANHLKSVYDNTPSKVSSNSIISYYVASTDNLSVLSVTDADVRKAIRRLKPSKSVGLDGIPGFIIKGRTHIFVPLLKYIFNLSFSAAVSFFLEKSCYCTYFLKKATVL
jgi:hypothetical protein